LFCVKKAERKKREKERDREREPALHAEQVEDDEAPVTVEYVPAKASDEDYGYTDLKTRVYVNITKEEGEKMGH
jgi:hypothetical protein